MVTVNSISATPRGSMGRGLSSLEPGERRAQRSASTLSPDYLALDRSRFASHSLIRASIFLLPLSFRPFYLIVSVILFTTPSFSPQNSFSLFSLSFSALYFSFFHLLYFFFLPLLFYNSFIILSFFCHTENSTSSILLYIHKHLFSLSRSCVFFLLLFPSSSSLFLFSSLFSSFLKSLLPLSLAIAHFTTRSNVLRLCRAPMLIIFHFWIASGPSQSQVLQYTTRGEVAFGVNMEDGLEIRGYAGTQFSTNICIKAERAIFFMISSLFAIRKNRRNFITLQIFNHFKGKIALILFVLSSPSYCFIYFLNILYLYFLIFFCSITFLHRKSKFCIFK